MIEKLGYSIEEAVQATGLGRTTVYGLLRSGELNSIKVGRRRIILHDDIRAYLAAQPSAAELAEAKTA